MENIEIIKEIDDQDVYKKYMQYFFIKQGLGDVIVEYEFFNRGGTKFTPHFKEFLEFQINQMALLYWSQPLIESLKSKCPFLPDSYFEYLKTEYYNPKEVTITQEGEDISIKIKGPIKSAINWEVPLMAVISELNNMSKGVKFDSENKRVETYLKKYNGFKDLGVKVSEFGTRRRASLFLQNESLFYLKKIAPECLTGTSNISLGRRHDLPLKGTIAHEVYMFYAALYGLENANQLVTKQWWETFGANVDTILPDTFTSPYFFKTIEPEYLEKFRAIRQDSMEPKEFTDLIVNHYNSLNINPKTKTVIYSDNINSLEKLKEIHEYVQKFVNPTYGIGTWLSNDCGSEKMNMVIKLTALYLPNGKIPCAKLSDIIGKITGDKETAYKYIKQIETK